MKQNVENTPKKGMELVKYLKNNPILQKKIVDAADIITGTPTATSTGT